MAPALAAEGRPASWQPSPRLQRLRRDHEESRPAVGAERALHYTEFFRREASRWASPPLRMAHALRDHLEKRTIRIYPGEIVVGTHTEHRIGAICHVELTGGFMLEDLFRFPRRRTNPLDLAPGIRGRLLRECLPYWLGRNLVRRAFPLREYLRYTADQLRARDYIVNEAGGIAHFLPDYAGVIGKGTSGMRREVTLRMEAPGDLAPEQRDWLQASLVVLDALDAFARRYRDLARAQGRDDVAEVLEVVPANPARTLRQALQAIWLFQMLIQIESLDQGISLGRIDQLLAPLHQEERRAGTFAEDDFKETLAAFCLKLSEVIPLFSSRITRYHGGLPSGQAATIGGIDAEGRCAANDLTFLILDVMDRFRTRQPNWHARLSARSRPEYVERVMHVVASGGGSPAVYDDEVIMEAMRRRGAPPRRVHDYATVGCVEPALPGESLTSSDAAIVNLPAALERVFRDRKALPSIRNTDDLVGAFERELHRILSALHRSLSAIERAHATWHPTPFSSLTIGGCLERATDATAGGARFNASGIQGVGVADVADSLAAVERVVFGQRECTLPDLGRAMRRNFRGREALRAKLRNAPKFGNDDARADDLARRVAEAFDRQVSSFRNTRGGAWVPGLYSMTCHRAFGARTGALPSGRRAGESLADGIACADGEDRLGPTASLSSSARVDHSRFANGVNLNLKLDARILGGADGPGILGALVRTYFRRGGMQVQANVLDPRVLLEALADPAKHRHLLVRVSGYCAYFADLTPEMQREIVARTLHGGGEGRDAHA
ncbi:MAG TPA: pyruvate formate lyase family protein [Anaeromyxobacteraceae bacterium]|nr:pyruvate formate lyase family protein [Anaeromyxobacteraceae bacterium]